MRRNFESLAMMFGGIGLVMALFLGGTIFFAAPIGGINAVDQLIEMGPETFDLAQSDIVPGMMSTAFNFVIGLFSVTFTICEIIVRPPAFRDSRNWYDPIWKKWNFVSTIALIVCLAVFAVAGYLAYFAFQTIIINVQLAGAILKALQISGMILVSVGAIGKVLFT